MVWGKLVLSGYNLNKVNLWMVVFLEVFLTVTSLLLVLHYDSGQKHFFKYVCQYIIIKSAAVCWKGVGKNSGLSFFFTHSETATYIVTKVGGLVCQDNPAVLSNYF